MRPGTVRRISAEWHGGQTSAVYALASTGAILHGCSSELQASLQQAQLQRDTSSDPQEWIDSLGELGALWEWVEQTGLRGPVDGWHLKWTERGA